VNEDLLRTAVEAIGGRIADLLAGIIDLEKEEGPCDQSHSPHIQTTEVGVG
jgi:hypothetical protein